MDVIYQGETWTRQVTIVDGAATPIDPDELVAVLCPETPITVTGPDDPGVYHVTLTAEETAALPARLQTKWELLASIDGAALFLVRYDVQVVATCARVTPP